MLEARIFLVEDTQMQRLMDRFDRIGIVKCEKHDKVKTVVNEGNVFNIIVRLL